MKCWNCFGEITINTLNTQEDYIRCPHCNVEHDSRDITQWIEAEQIAQRQIPGATITMPTGICTPTGIITTWVTNSAAPAPTTATKHDSGKVDLTHIRYDAISQVAEVFMFGEKKYGRGNYLTGMSHLRLLAAASRHLMAYISGESTDPESGESHLAHLGCCTLMLLTYNANGLGTDDRDPHLTTKKK